MLVHKVDGKNPVGYSDLLLGARKLERRTENRDPLPPKTAVTSALNVTCSQTSGNLIPLHKLKGNCPFTIQAVNIGSNELEDNSDVKQEGNEEAASLAD